MGRFISCLPVETAQSPNHSASPSEVQSQMFPHCHVLSYILKMLCFKKKKNAMLFPPLTLITLCPKRLAWPDDIFIQKRGVYTPWHFSWACPSVRRFEFNIFNLVYQQTDFIYSEYTHTYTQDIRLRNQKYGLNSRVIFQWLGQDMSSGLLFFFFPHRQKKASRWIILFEDNWNGDK